MLTENLNGLQQLRFLTLELSSNSFGEVNFLGSLQQLESLTLEIGQNSIPRAFEIGRQRWIDPGLRDWIAALDRFAIQDVGCLILAGRLGLLNQLQSLSLGLFDNP